MILHVDKRPQLYITQTKNHLWEASLDQRPYVKTVISLDMWAGSVCGLKM